MKLKNYWILVIFIIILINGCATETVTEISLEKEVEETEQIQEEIPKTEEKVSPLQDEFSNVKGEIDHWVEKGGNSIGQDHYDRLYQRLQKLEEAGISKGEIDLYKEKLIFIRVDSKPAEDIQEEESKEAVAPQHSFRNDPEIPSTEEMEQVPDCEGKFFSVTPVDLSKVYEITPLGNLGPPGHTFPTEHTYLHFSGGGTSTGTFPLYAPADVYLTHVSSRYEQAQDPEDHTIYFALCKDIIGYYNHVKFLSDEMKSILKDIECEKWTINPGNSCPRNLLYKVEAGTLLGQVGRLQGNFDFGVMDFREQHAFANPQRYGTRTFHIQCPYDYYNENMKQQFFDLIERDDEQQCGIIAQDIPATLKGNWFYEGITDNIADWNSYLAFVQDNEFPNVEVVSVAGIFTDSAKFEFNPKDSGFVNREFSQVIPNGNIYCYQAEDVEKFQASKPTGKILVQLTSDTELQIEHQSGSCSGSYKFINHTVYNR